MRVYLDEALFESPNTDPVALVEIIGQARDGRHHILLSPSFKADDDRDLPRKQWLQRQEERLRQQLAKRLELSASEASMSTPDAPRITIVEGNHSDWSAGKLTILDALDLLRAPLRLLVENSRHDWAFLLAMANGAHRRALRDAERKKWIEVQHGGGLGDIKAWLRTLVTPAANDAAWHITRLRSWVMFDRDADADDPRRPSRDSSETLELCRDPALQGPWSFPHLQLHRRTIESYLPLEALEAHEGPMVLDGARTARVSALAVLREEHSASAFAYSMKEGFMKDARTIDKRDRAVLRQAWKSAPSAAGRDQLVPIGDVLPEAWRTLPSDIVAELLFGFGAHIADEFERCDTEPRWEEWVAREYDRGPAGQPSRAEIATQILELV